MPIKKDKKKSSKKIVVKKTSKKGKTSQSQSITVNINKGKSAPKQPSGKPTIASSIASLASVIQSRDFYKPKEVSFTPIKTSVATQVEPPKENIKKYFKPVEEVQMTPSIEKEPIIRIGKTITVKRVGGKFTLPEQPVEEIVTPPEPLSSASANYESSEEEVVFETPKPKKSKRDKYDIRYENAFGQPYMGGNIKQSDYLKMIQDREAINKSQKKLEKEYKKQSNK